MSNESQGSPEWTPTVAAAEKATDVNEAAVAPPAAAPSEPESVLQRVTSDAKSNPPASQPESRQQDESQHHGPRLRIGSQRPGAQKVRARPQFENKSDEPPQRKFPPPNKRQQLSPELEAELAEAMGGLSVSDFVDEKAAPQAVPQGLELESRVVGRVIKVHREDVFVDLGQRYQGIAPLRQFETPPEPGAEVEVVVSRFDPEEGLYELTKPGQAMAVADWSELSEGVLVEARVTGHNKGGLEAEVNHIRAFIPAGQVSLYRIEDFSQLVGERLLCVVMQCQPDRRNLVLSRKAVLEREQEEAKQRLLEELEPGQIREGVVRNIRDFGAFVDLGGVDGLLHVSQLSWARVKHPSEVLELGQKVKVKIQKIDPDTKKISLAMKELTESPWANVASKYPVRSTVTGTVSKIMDFGAFVQLEPGVEGLVHISELAHGRVFRVSDIVKEGQEIEAQVTSVDEEKQRIGLSIKAIQARPVAAKKEGEPAEEEAVPVPQPKHKGPLKGGLGRGTGGDGVGLNW